MSGSFLLKQRNLLGSAYDVSNFGAVDTELGGWSSHVIKPMSTSRCHPNYEAIPIGNNPLGFAICRKKVIDGRTLDLPAPHVTGENNGYHKFASDLYDPKLTTQTQMYNPDRYYDRKTPEESYLQTNDYLTRNVRYNGNGIIPMNTPGGLYREYAFDYTPIPPPKYDVVRLQQPFELWKDRKLYLKEMSREQMDTFEQNYQNVRTSGTW